MFMLPPELPPLAAYVPLHRHLNRCMRLLAASALESVASLVAHVAPGGRIARDVSSDADHRLSTS